MATREDRDRQRSPLFGIRPQRLAHRIGLAAHTPSSSFSVLIFKWTCSPAHAVTSWQGRHQCWRQCWPRAWVARALSAHFRANFHSTEVPAGQRHPIKLLELALRLWTHRHPDFAQMASPSSFLDAGVNNILCFRHAGCDISIPWKLTQTCPHWPPPK